MNGREYIERVMVACQQVEYIDKLTAGPNNLDLSSIYQRERTRAVAICEEAERLFGQMPSACWSQIMRRKCFYGWSMNKIACEIGISTRGAYYAFSDALKWVEGHSPSNFHAS